MPVLLALEKLSNKENNDIHIEEDLLRSANRLITRQQQQYGRILQLEIIPQLKEKQINLLYGQPFPPEIQKPVTRYFLSQVMAFLQPVYLDQETNFFLQIMSCISSLL